MYINCRGIIMSHLIILKSIKEMQHEKAKKETKVIISNILCNRTTITIKELRNVLGEQFINNCIFELRLQLDTLHG